MPYLIEQQLITRLKHKIEDNIHSVLFVRYVYVLEPLHEELNVSSVDTAMRQYWQPPRGTIGTRDEIKLSRGRRLCKWEGERECRTKSVQMKGITSYGDIVDRYTDCAVVCCSLRTLCTDSGLQLPVAMVTENTLSYKTTQPIVLVPNLTVITTKLSWASDNTSRRFIRPHIQPKRFAYRTKLSKSWPIG